MRHVFLAFSALVLLVSPASAGDNNNDCKIVERDGPPPAGGLSTSVQAGNGTVSAQTSGAGGVTMHSGNGSMSSTVTTSGSGQSQMVTTNSDGSCTIYRYKEKKHD